VRLHLPFGGPWLDTDCVRGWFRLWSSGPGLRWTRGRPLFSERHGHARPVLRVGPWRVFVLPRVRS